MNMLLIQIVCGIIVGGCLFGYSKTETQYLKILCIFGMAFFTMFFVGTIL